MRKTHKPASVSAMADATASPITLWPAARAETTSFSASLLITCTTYNGVLMCAASLMARPVASPCAPGLYFEWNIKNHHERESLYDLAT